MNPSMSASSITSTVSIGYNARSFSITVFLTCFKFVFRDLSAGKGSPTNAQSESVKREHKLVHVARLGREEEHQLRGREVR